jgi:exodeoxyribonuclease VII large subunit
LSRTRKPDSDPLWGDPGPDEASPSTGRSANPPDWALPSWDSFDDPAESARAPKASPSVRPTFEPVEVEAGAGLVPAQASAPAPAPEPVLRILAVSDVTRAIRDAVRAEPLLRDVWVEGEVGRVTVSSAGHCYFTLKDDRSQLACVFFRDDRLASPFEARTGLRVVAHGRIDIFEGQGVYQLYVSAIQPSGFGDLALEFEALKARLAAEGLFATARKRPLPVRPAVIGVATSATGAVWHDICQVVARRWPLARLVLSPCQVQGEGSAQSVVAALDRLARWRERLIAAGRDVEAPTVTILARGGGSLEDLWSFNDERVVRAVVAHPVPVVCGVGHEVDVTLADFAADVRAPTPSAAAELVVPERLDVAIGLAELSRRSRARVISAVGTARAEVASESRALERLRPEAQLAQAREKAGYLLDRATRRVRDELRRREALQATLAARMSPAVQAKLSAARGSLERLEAALAALGPQATLERGYAIVRRDPDGLVVRDPAEAPAGQLLAVRVARGQLSARVERGAGPAAGPESK